MRRHGPRPRSRPSSNAHVVGSEKAVTVVLKTPTTRAVKGTVVAKGFEGDPDLAVIRIARGGLPTVKFAREAPKEGAPIAIAGYPWKAQRAFAAISGEALPIPSVHLGTVSAVSN